MRKYLDLAANYIVVNINKFFLELKWKINILNKGTSIISKIKSEYDLYEVARASHWYFILSHCDN